MGNFELQFRSRKRLKLPHAVVLDAVRHRSTQMSAEERKSAQMSANTNPQKSAKGCKRSAKERRRALPQTHAHTLRGAFAPASKEFVIDKDLCFLAAFSLRFWGVQSKERRVRDAYGRFTENCHKGGVLCRRPPIKALTSRKIRTSREVWLFLELRETSGEVWQMRNLWIAFRIHSVRSSWRVAGEILGSPGISQKV